MSDAAATTETTPTEAPEPQDSYFPATDNWADPPVTEDPVAPEDAPAPEPTDDGQQGGDPTSTASQETGATDPDREWLTQADTALDIIGGRGNLPVAIDYAARLFGLTKDGPNFLEKLKADAPGVYNHWQAQLIADAGENLPAELEAKVFEKYGITQENIENYRAVDMYGFDKDLIMSDQTTREFLEGIQPADRQTFQNAPKDVQAAIIEEFEKNRPTMVDRLMRAEAHEQKQKVEGQKVEYDQKQAVEAQLGQRVNEKLTADIAGLVAEFAKTLKIPTRYASGIMADALQEMRNVTDEKSPLAVAYNGFIAATRDNNEMLANQHLRVLRMMADQHFRQILQKEQEQTGEYNFQGFFKPAVKAAAAPAQSVQPQPAQRPAPKPEDVFKQNWVEPEFDLNKVLSL